MKTTPRLPAFVLTFLLLASLVSACGATASGTIGDPGISERIKLLLLNDPVVRPEAIEVQTFKGSVTLSGRIRSKEAEEKAIALARTIRGVKDVKSTLQIQPN